MKKYGLQISVFSLIAYGYIDVTINRDFTSSIFMVVVQHVPLFIAFYHAFLGISEHCPDKTKLTCWLSLWLAFISIGSLDYGIINYIDKLYLYEPNADIPGVYLTNVQLVMEKTVLFTGILVTISIITYTLSRDIVYLIAGSGHTFWLINTWHLQGKNLYIMLLNLPIIVVIWLNFWSFEKDVNKLAKNEDHALVRAVKAILLIYVVGFITILNPILH